MRFACWITKAIDTHSKYTILLAFARQQCYANAPQKYVNTYVAFLVLFKDTLSVEHSTARAPLSSGALQSSGTLCHDVELRVKK
jgi:hypothetical protein